MSEGRLAVEEPDAHGEDLVEAALAEIELFEGRHEELGPARLDMLSVPARRGFDHLRRAVDRRETACLQALANHRRRHTMAAADLEHAVARLDVEPLDDALKPLAHAATRA